MKKTALIIGATGKTGMPVVEQAIAAGLKVRAVIRREGDRSERLRRAGAETVFGDVHDMKSVRELVEGVGRIYFAYPPQLDRLVEATANLSLASSSAGVEAIVNMSQITARESARSPLSHQHWLSEHIFDHSEMCAIHIRPTFFAENFLLFNAAGIASEGKMYLPYGTRGQAPIAANDIARVVVQLLLDPEAYRGERLQLTGPERFTIPEIADVIGIEIGSPVEYVSLPEARWKDILVNQVGLPEFLASHLYYVAQDHQEGYFDKVTDTVEEITGTPAQEFKEFVREHRRNFLGEEAVFLGV